MHIDYSTSRVSGTQVGCIIGNRHTIPGYQRIAASVSRKVRSSGCRDQQVGFSLVRQVVFVSPDVCWITLGSIPVFSQLTGNHSRLTRETRIHFVTLGIPCIIFLVGFVSGKQKSVALGVHFVSEPIPCVQLFPPLVHHVRCRLFVVLTTVETSRVLISRHDRFRIDLQTLDSGGVSRLNVFSGTHPTLASVAQASRFRHNVHEMPPAARVSASTLHHVLSAVLLPPHTQRIYPVQSIALPTPGYTFGLPILKRMMRPLPSNQDGLENAGRDHSESAARSPQRGAGPVSADVEARHFPGRRGGVRERPTPRRPLSGRVSRQPEFFILSLSSVRLPPHTGHMSHRHFRIHH